MGQSRSRKPAARKLLEENKKWASLAAAHNEIESVFIDQGLEHGALVSEDGRLIVEEIGVENYVEFFVHDLKKLSNGAFFHNHPSGNSFSLADIKIACDYNPVSLSAFGINPKGIAYSYTMHRPKGGWPSSRGIAQLYAKAVVSAKIFLYRRHKKGLISMPDFDLEIAHEEMKKLAKLIAAQYHRRRRK